MKMKMKSKIKDFLGYVLFLLIFIIMIPLLFIRGGIVGCIRYYQYISAKVYNKKPKSYYY